MIARALLLLVILSAAAGSARAGVSEDALAAYGRGDHATALQLWQPLAEQADRTAEFWVCACFANLYERGQGVPADYALTAAVIWYRRAADQGYQPAQANLGALHFTGRGVKRRARAVIFQDGGNAT